MEQLADFPVARNIHVMKGDFEKYLRICEEYSEISYVDVLYDSGIIFVNMAPPTTRHNLISAEIITLLKNGLKGKRTCAVSTSDEEYILIDSSRAKPDVSILCKDYRNGSIPVFAVEVLSPSNGADAPDAYEFHFGRKISKLLASGCKAVLCVRQDIQEAYLHTMGFREYETYRLDDRFTVPGLDIDLCVSALYPENLDLF